MVRRPLLTGANRAFCLVTGSRAWPGDLNDIPKTLRGFAAANPGASYVLVNGGCPGITSVDFHATECAKDLLWAIVTFYAKWEEYGKRAGPRRNQEMVDFVAGYASDHVVAVHAWPALESKGTVDCIRRAVKAGLPVIEHGVDGSVRRRGC